jgi:microcin C transport system substrate-binding protein
MDATNEAPMITLPDYRHPTRRAVLSGPAIAIASLVVTRDLSHAELGPQFVTRHGLSAFGDLAEQSGFKAFSYVQPNAPKGGTISQDVYGTFNSLNPYILRGDPPSGMGLVFDSLMAPSFDERDSLYGLIAHTVCISPDKRELCFELRKEARFHDYTSLTAHDVVFSINILKQKGNPTVSQSLQGIQLIQAKNDHEVVVILASGLNRELPLTIASQPIFSASYYATRSFDETSLDPPLGSGPYKVGAFEQGRYISYERVTDYWAGELPVNVGQNNFDIIRYEYFPERPVAFQAFKAGVYTLHEEFTAATWVRGYDFPAVEDGRVIREELPDANISGVQGWFFNTRREVLRDPRIREAIGNAFDFDWTNKNLMYGAYKRTQSFFENSDMAARGLPDAAVLALLEPLRGKVPDEVFGEPYISPNSDGSGQDRALLRRASDLLFAAGCTHNEGTLAGPDGRPLTIEFLDFSAAFTRVTQLFIKNLRLLGIDAQLRIVDAAQYRKRVDDFDFDITTQRLIMSFAPGEELRALFGSQAAGTFGSRNITGISDPAIDSLISEAIAASKRDEVVAICRSLDRLLRAKRLWVPQWYKGRHWIAHWNVFGHPKHTPKFNPGIIRTWWSTETK